MNLKKFMAFIILCVILSTCCSCGNKKTDDGDSSKDENITEKTEADTVDGTTVTEAVTSETEKNKNIWEELRQESVYKNSLVDGTDNIYKLNMEAYQEYRYIYILGICENRLYLFLSDDSNHNCIAVYDIYSMESIKTMDVDGGCFYGNVYIDDKGNMVLYNLENNELIAYDGNMNETGRHTITQGITNTYTMSDDLSSFYYVDAADGIVRKLDMNTGNTEQVCAAYTEQYGNSGSIVGYIDEPECLVFSVYDEAENTSMSCFVGVSKDDAVINEVKADMYNFQSKGENYITLASKDTMSFCAYGTASEKEPGILFTGDMSTLSIEADMENNMLFTANSNSVEGFDEISLNTYDYTVGRRICESTFKLPAGEYGNGYAEEGAYVAENNLLIFSLAGDYTELYLWDMNMEDSKADDTSNYLYSWKDITSPSKETKQELKDKAKDIGKKNGVEIYLFEDVQSCTKDVYEYRTSNNAILTSAALDTLDKALSKYPDGMLGQLDDDYGSILKIYLAEEIMGMGDESSLETASGIQNTLYEDTFLVLDIDDGSYENTIYHEIFHAIEKHMDNEEFWFFEEEWQNNNPEGFEYYYNYSDYINDNERQYVADSAASLETAFIDSYSKCYASEDRARIMEYAMTDTKNGFGYFDYEMIAAKLTDINTKIRECFDTSGWPTVTEWEKVLQ